MTTTLRKMVCVLQALSQMPTQQLLPSIKDAVSRIAASGELNYNQLSLAAKVEHILAAVGRSMTAQDISQRASELRVAIWCSEPVMPIAKFLQSAWSGKVYKDEFEECSWVCPVAQAACSLETAMLSPFCYMAGTAPSLAKEQRSSAGLSLALRPSLRQPRLSPRLGGISR